MFADPIWSRSLLILPHHSPMKRKLEKQPSASILDDSLCAHATQTLGENLPQHLRGTLQSGDSGTVSHGVLAINDHLLATQRAVTGYYSSAILVLTSIRMVHAE